jgi:nicotinamidase-related amidase
MKTKNLLLIIDMQNDFCQPQGSLYVPGADDDAIRLSRFITENTTKIDDIILTQDNHQVIDISHPGFWSDNKGKCPEPFTSITPEDILQKKWMPKFFVDEAVDYIKRLNDQGEFAHVIWPEHCIYGSEGAAIQNNVLQAVSQWARAGHFYGIIQKGLNPVTEHFGALRANVPIENDTQTQPNSSLIEKLSLSENIIIAGEAKSHCVANTIKQILETEAIRGQLIILEDAMSNVQGFEKLAVSIYQQALDKGAILTTTEKLNLNLKK